jgi:UPF0755 protein
MTKFREPEPTEKSPLRWIARMVLLLLTVSICLVASLFVYSRWQQTRLQGIAEIGGGAVGLNPLELLFLESYLSLNADALESPVGSGNQSLTFVVEPGETAETIANNLIAAGLLQDIELFVRYVRYTGLDGQMEVGKYLLTPDMTIPDLALALSQSGIRDVEIIFLDGWRISEMVKYLEATRPANIDPAEFANLTAGRSLFDRSRYDFLSSVPEDSSLEGFLFPGSYVIPVEADASFLIDIMLSRFSQQIPEQFRNSYDSQGLSIYDAVTLASIIQKETRVKGEMGLMASVYGNRLSDGMLLQADPTVQYVIGYHEESSSWWKSPLAAADLLLDSPYNTYLYGGLPPGPITNPALAALQAVAAPAQSDFLFFVADCNAEIAGSHVFSRDFEEHLVNVNQCR